MLFIRLTKFSDWFKPINWFIQPKMVCCYPIWLNQTNISVDSAEDSSSFKKMIWLNQVNFFLDVYWWYKKKLSIWLMAAWYYLRYVYEVFPQKSFSYLNKIFFNKRNFSIALESEKHFLFLEQISCLIFFFSETNIKLIEKITFIESK